MTAVRISNPFLLGDLCATLAAEDDCLVDATGRNSLEISVLGSYSQQAMRHEIRSRVAAWVAAHRSRGVEVSADVG